VVAELEQLVGDGRERRSHDAWFPLSGRHCDGLQVRRSIGSQFETAAIGTGRVWCLGISF
jgi:hypothetical protein